MSILYITQPEANLSKNYEAFNLALKKPDGTWEKRSIPAQTIQQIVLIGNPGITGDALSYAMELGLSVHYLSIFGKHLGVMLPSESRNGQLRLGQYRLYHDTEKRLELVKRIVVGKIHNQYQFLYRHGATNNSLKQRKKLVHQKSTLDEVRGVEGLAAREYFSYLQGMLDPVWSFTGRHRPATDPVNALLSFGYGLLRVQVMTAAHLAGLDLYVGYLHETTRGQPSIVLDLMEEFRSLVADNVVFSVINRQQIKPSDFTESLGVYRLSDTGRKTFLEAFEAKMNSEFKHPIFNYQCHYRRAIELQARLLSRYIQEGVDYQPLTLR